MINYIHSSGKIPIYRSDDEESVDISFDADYEKVRTQLQMDFAAWRLTIRNGTASIYGREESFDRTLDVVSKYATVDKIRKRVRSSYKTNGKIQFDIYCGWTHGLHTCSINTTVSEEYKDYISGYIEAYGLECLKWHSDYNTIIPLYISVYNAEPLEQYMELFSLFFPMFEKVKVEFHVRYDTMLFFSLPPEKVEIVDDDNSGKIRREIELLNTVRGYFGQ